MRTYVYTVNTDAFRPEKNINKAKSHDIGGSEVGRGSHVTANIMINQHRFLGRLILVPGII